MPLDAAAAYTQAQRLDIDTIHAPSMASWAWAPALSNTTMNSNNMSASCVNETVMSRWRRIETVLVLSPRATPALRRPGRVGGLPLPAVLSAAAPDAAATSVMLIGTQMLTLDSARETRPLTVTASGPQAGSEEADDAAAAGDDPASFVAAALSARGDMLALADSSSTIALLSRPAIVPTPRARAARGRRRGRALEPTGWRARELRARELRAARLPAATRLRGAAGSANGALDAARDAVAGAWAATAALAEAQRDLAMPGALTGYAELIGGARGVSTYAQDGEGDYEGEDEDGAVATAPAGAVPSTLRPPTMRSDTGNNSSESANVFRAHPLSDGRNLFHSSGAAMGELAPDADATAAAAAPASALDKRRAPAWSVHSQLQLPPALRGHRLRALWLLETTAQPALRALPAPAAPLTSTTVVAFTAEGLVTAFDLTPALDTPPRRAFAPVAAAAAPSLRAADSAGSAGAGVAVQPALDALRTRYPYTTLPDPAFSTLPAPDVSTTTAPAIGTGTETAKGKSNSAVGAVTAAADAAAAAARRAPTTGMPEDGLWLPRAVTPLPLPCFALLSWVRAGQDPEAQLLPLLPACLLASWGGILRHVLRTAAGTALRGKLAAVPAASARALRLAMRGALARLTPLVAALSPDESATTATRVAWAVHAAMARAGEIAGPASAAPARALARARAGHGFFAEGWGLLAWLDWLAAWAGFALPAPPTAEDDGIYARAVAAGETPALPTGGWATEDLATALREALDAIGPDTAGSAADGFAINFVYTPEDDDADADADVMADSDLGLGAQSQSQGAGVTGRGRGHTSRGQQQETERDHDGGDDDEED